MKLVIIEPLGVEEEKLMEIAHKALLDSVEIVSYQTKVTDTESLIERGKDADIIMVANLPLNAEVIKGCKNLKMLAVAFTGIDHIAMDACKEQGITVCNCAGLFKCCSFRPCLWTFDLTISKYHFLRSGSPRRRNQGWSGWI